MSGEKICKECSAKYYDYFGNDDIDGINKCNDCISPEDLGLTNEHAEGLK